MMTFKIAHIHNQTRHFISHILGSVLGIVSYSRNRLLNLTHTFHFGNLECEPLDLIFQMLYVILILLKLGLDARVFLLQLLLYFRIDQILARVGLCHAQIWAGWPSKSPQICVGVAVPDCHRFAKLGGIHVSIRGVHLRSGSFLQGRRILEFISRARELVGSLGPRLSHRARKRLIIELV